MIKLYGGHPLPANTQPTRHRQEKGTTDRLPAGFNSAYNWGWEQHPVHKKWDAAFDALMTDSEAELPTDFAGVS